MHRQQFFIVPVLVCVGCASGPRMWRPVGSAPPPGYSLFNITLHCDDAYEQATENLVPTMEQMVEMELSGEPWMPGEEDLGPEGWGVPFDSCDALLKTMRDGSDELLSTVKYRRAQGF